MKVYAMFVRIVLDTHIATDGWRFEGMTTDPIIVDRFVAATKLDIEEIKNNIVFTRTVDYKVVELS